MRLNRQGTLFDNWKRLATELNLDEYIDEFEQARNPTEEVIRTAENQGKIRSLDDLRTALVQMNRRDCVEDYINKYLPENEIGSEDVCQSDNLSDCESGEE